MSSHKHSESTRVKYKYSMSLLGFVCMSSFTDNMEAFLSLAERQFIVKNELDGLRAQRDVRVPGLSGCCTLHHRDSICECCQRRLLPGTAGR